MDGTSDRTVRAHRRGNGRKLVVVALLAGASMLLFDMAAGAAAAPVGLGTAAGYSVLGGQTVTNTGPTTLSGDLGVSPGTAITGFPPGTVGGATHAGDAAAAQAQSDLVIAYDDAAGRAPTASVAGDLVGQTLTAGVYKSTGPLALGGTLTLDAQGDPGAVFIFQVASTLITASSSTVAVINGAQACHVFWQVGSSATLGTTSTFVGTIMALTSISVTTGSTVAGRALARNGAVTLDDDTFTSALCATTPPDIETSTALTASPNPAAVGDTVTLSAAVTAQGPVTTGKVTFTEQGGLVLGTANIDATGHAKLTIPAGSTAQTRTITAHYGGHRTLTASTSSPTDLVVRAPVTPTSTSSPTTTTVTTATTASTAPTTRTTAPTTTTRAASVSTSTATAPALSATGPKHVAGLIGFGAALVGIGLICLWSVRARRRPSHRG